MQRIKNPLPEVYGYIKRTGDKCYSLQPGEEGFGVWGY